MFEKGVILTKDFPEKVIIHNKKSRRNKHLLNIINYEFHWRILKKGPPFKEWHLESKMHPKDSIGNQLNNSFLIEKLNTDYIFDFDYEPEEFDNLQILEISPGYGYLSFVYTNGEWIKDYPHYFHENSLKHYGYVKPVK